MRKVIHVLNELNPSGAEVMLEAAGEYWLQHGVLAHVLSVGKIVGPFKDKLDAAGYSVVHIPRQYSVTFFKQLFKLFREYDVVHIHTEHWSFYYGIIATLAGCRTVRTIHNNFQFGGHVRLKLMLQRWFLSRIGVIHVAISEGVMANELAYYFNSSRVVNNWLNIELMDQAKNNGDAKFRATLDLPPDAIIISVVGNCSHIKNHMPLIQAMKWVTDYMPNVYLVHAGSGEQESDEKHLAKELGVEKNVIFLGRTSEVPSLLLATDIYVMPSLHEGFSIALLEALYSQLPCILADRPGLSGMGNTFDCIAYSEPTDRSIADTICVVLDDLASWKERGTNNPELIRGKYSVATGVKNYSLVYLAE